VKTILITGAGGGIGGHLRREFAGKYRMRLSDIRPIENLSSNESFEAADIADPGAMARVTEGVDAIVHLGGYSVEGPWEDILQANIVGCYNVFEAARSNGVKRIIFATSSADTAGVI
jgi:uronate dehydrogenase